MIDNMFKKKFYVFAVCFLVFTFFLDCTALYAAPEANETTDRATDTTSLPVVRGKILEKVDEKTETSSIYEITYQYFKVQILTGDHKGKVITALNTYDNGSVYKVIPDVGDEVMLSIEEDEGMIYSTTIAEISRQKILLFLLIIFLITLIACGGKKGIKTVITLALTLVSVMTVLLPCLMAGYSPIPITVAICAGVSAVALLIVSGFNRKTLSAILGTTGGVIVAGLIAFLFGSWGKLTGLGDEEMQMLALIPQTAAFDFRGLLFASIIIGALGAVMDVGMGIASSLYEIKEIRPDLKPLSLIKAGMNVGRDTMGTMSNTLILAYAGSSLPLMMLLLAYDKPISEYINWENIASEIIRALAGSIGLVLTIPLTALISAVLYQKIKPKSAPDSDEQETEQEDQEGSGQEKEFDQEDLDQEASKKGRSTKKNLIKKILAKRR